MERGEVRIEVQLLPRHWRREVGILVLLVIGCAVPFLGNPFHMDDNFYMDMARNAQQNPLFPNDVPYIFQGEFYQDVGSHTHPLFVTYFLAVIQRFFGEGPGREWIYHVFALVFPILAAVSFYFICARLVQRPLWPSVLLSVCPLFLVMQHTLMTDLPTLAFWLGAIACFLWASDVSRSGLYLASTIFQAAAMFTSYQAFALTPLLAFYHFRRGGEKKGWLCLVPAPLLVIGWFALNCLHYQRLLFLGTLEYMQSRDPLAPAVLGTKFLSVLEYQGWLIMFPVFVFYLFARGLKGRLLVLALLGATAVAQIRVPEYRLIDKTIFVVGLAAGFFVLVAMGRVAWSACRRFRGLLNFGKVDEEFLALWYFGVLFYCVFLLTEGSARYILPLIPPFLICYVRHLEILEAAEYRLPPRLLNSAMQASGCLVVTLIWGLLLSHADQAFARVYPEAARDFRHATGSAESYCAGEWGFRYYLGREGVRPLPADETLVRGGSFLAVPKMALPYDIPASLRSMMLPIQTLSYKTKTPLRVMDWQSPAGFYSSGWGLIPFSFSRNALEEIEIHQVSFMVERLPWAQIKIDADINPWPGYVTFQGKSRLAILAKPGTRMVYPIVVRDPVRLELFCGPLMDLHNGFKGEHTFAVRQLNAEGKTLAEAYFSFHPVRRKEDLKWQPVRLFLQKTAKGFLDFEYLCKPAGCYGTGAFAEAVLKPVE